MQKCIFDFSDYTLLKQFSIRVCAISMQKYFCKDQLALREEKNCDASLKKPTIKNSFLLLRANKRFIVKIANCLWE